MALPKAVCAAEAYLGSLDSQVIVCNGDHIEALTNPPDIRLPYLNTIAGCHLAKDDTDFRMKTGRDTSIKALVSWFDPNAHKPWMEKYTPSMYIHQEHIRELRREQWPSLTKERLEKAVRPDTKYKIGQIFENLGQVTFGPILADKMLYSNVDTLQGLEFTILHEVSETPRSSPGMVDMTVPYLRRRQVC